MQMLIFMQHADSPGACSVAFFVASLDNFPYQLEILQLLVLLSNPPLSNLPHPGIVTCSIGQTLAVAVGGYGVCHILLLQVYFQNAMPGAVSSGLNWLIQFNISLLQNKADGKEIEQVFEYIMVLN